MIVKPFEIKNKKENKFFLFYGENQGYKNQIINDEFKKKIQKAFIAMKKVKFYTIKKVFLQIFYQNHFLKMKN